MNSTLLSVFLLALLVTGEGCSSGSGGSAGAGGTANSGGTSAAAGSSGDRSSGGSARSGGASNPGSVGTSAGSVSGGGTGGAQPTGGSQPTGAAVNSGGAHLNGGASGTAAAPLTGGVQGSAGAAAFGGGPSSGGTQSNTVIRRRTITTRGFTFDALETVASGEPVLLLHGFPDTSLEWTDLMPVLSDSGYHCLAPDQRGYSPGARPAEVDAYRYEELVADAFAMGSELGTRFHVIGHDWGANVGWLMLQKDPSRIASFTAISIPHYQVWARSVYDDTTMSGYLSMLNTWMTEGKGEAYWTAEQLSRMWKSKPAARRDATIAHMTEPGAMTAALNWYRASRGHKQVIEEFDTWQVNVPTLLIHGSQDLGERSLTDTAPLMKGPYRVVRPDGGHFIVDEQPQAVAAEILTHLRSYPQK